MFIDEPDIVIADEFAKDLPAIQRDIKAGRVLYITAEPQSGNCWQMLQEFARIMNRVMKAKNPQTLRLLAVYDKAVDEYNSLIDGDAPTTPNGDF
jgi:hypothetical protein